MVHKLIVVDIKLYVWYFYETSGITAMMLLLCHLVSSRLRDTCTFCSLIINLISLYFFSLIFYCKATIV